MTLEQREYYSSKYKNLEDIPNVGPATATKLRELGFKTVESLATAPVQDLISNGIGDDMAYRVVEAARKAISIEFITAYDLHEEKKDRKLMTTGCSNLDGLLRGGLETQSITEFYGEFGSGKSQICQQLAVAVQLPEERGGLGAGCLYIDTEHVFRAERIIQMAEGLGLDPGEVLQNIIYAEAYTSQHQSVLLASADELIKEKGLKCIIVDSLTGHFRSEYVGREHLAPRQQALNRHMHKLIRLARAFNAAAVVTNQVSATPDAYIFEPRAIGGNIVGHIAHTRIYLRKARDNRRIAKIIASPFLPIGEAPFTISESGIVNGED